MRKNLKSYFALAILTLLVLGTIAFAKTICGPGSEDGSQGTYFWFRDNKWTHNPDRFWANRGHLHLVPERTYTFEWRGIDDSGLLASPKEAWHVFIMDAGEGFHGWEQILLQIRKDEAWVKKQGKKIIRFLVNWGGPGGQALVSAGAILDLRLVLRQNIEDDKWHIEAWYDDGGGWIQFVNLDGVDIATIWSGLPGNLTQACAGIQVDKDTSGPLQFLPAAPIR